MWFQISVMVILLIELYILWSGNIAQENEIHELWTELKEQKIDIDDLAIEISKLSK